MPNYSVLGEQNDFSRNILQWVLEYLSWTHWNKKAFELPFLINVHLEEPVSVLTEHCPIGS